MSVDATLTGAPSSPRLPGDLVRIDGPPGLPGRITADDVAIKDLGRCLLPSPVAAHLDARPLHFVGEADKVLVNDCLSDLGAHAGQLGGLPAFELAGPRNRVFFDPRTVRSRQRKQVDPTDDLWMSVIEATGQPKSFV
ncbi:MAG TPA: hypothetical protein VN914_21045 [Polyangia bacterium]|nr:hypothetical protein [Polyangia bacterium]